jgi:hypothetical protein
MPFPNILNLKLSGKVRQSLMAISLFLKSKFFHALFQPLLLDMALLATIKILSPQHPGSNIRDK